MTVMPEIDAVIVGCGAGGSAMAWRLANGGAKVLILEAGPAFDPGSDYKLDQPDWETKHFPDKPGSKWPYIVAPMPIGTPANKENSNDLRSWNKLTGMLYPGPERRVIGYQHVKGVGGSTLHFTGEAHRMNPKSMQMKTRFGVAADWPLTYDELEPYYIKAEKVLGVAGPDDPGARWRSAPFPLPAHNPSYSASHIGNGVKKIGMNWDANSVCAVSKPYDGRPPCNYCGNCLRGCMIRDKGSADVTFVAQALKTGRVSIMTGTQVTHLETGKGAGKNDIINKVVFVNANGEHLAVTARVVVLAGGAIQTPRLLLSNEICNESGQVGRNFMETLQWYSAGLHPEMLGSHRGHPSDSICWDMNAPDAIPGVIGGCRFSPATAEANLLGPISYAERVVPGWGNEHKKSMRESFGRALGLSSIGEFLPNDKTFIDLDRQSKDTLGMALPRIHVKLGNEEYKRLKFMAKTVRSILKAAGVTELFEEAGSWDSFNASHVFGTCRMGDDPSHNVVDAWGRSFKYKNLYIADASVFPSSGGGESPSLTIQALAIRAADKMLAKS